MTEADALGRHVLAEFHGCDPDILSDVTLIERHMVAAAQDAGATIANTSFHHFSPYGVSGVVVIHESHLAIHTWPEYGFAAVDLFTCGSAVDPWQAHRSLKSTLKATHDSTQEIQRGLIGDLAKPRALKGHSPQAARPTLPYSRNIWFTDRTDDIALSLRHQGCLYRKDSTFQKVEVLDTTGYGKMLVLDDRVMCTERDEFVYHEMITHVPVLTHPAPQRVLVIGGGDGGAARELLKHPSVEDIVVVEIDEIVVEASGEHFPDMASALDDPRVDLKIGDGIAFIQDCPAETFDVIIVDSTDPNPFAAGLFEEPFYAAARRALKPGGLMTAQSEPPVLYTTTFRNIYDRQRLAFETKNVHCYLAFIPTYTTGMISFSFASKDGAHPLRDVDSSRITRFVEAHPLRYYTEAVHRAAFALPGFVQDMLG